MLIVATMTGTLTTRLKKQEKVKAEAETERMRGQSAPGGVPRPAHPP